SFVFNLQVRTDTVEARLGTGQSLPDQPIRLKSPGGTEGFESLFLQRRVGFGRGPGQAGKSQALHLGRAMRSLTVTPANESGDKLTRFGPFSAQCRAGNVKIRRGPWNEDLFRVLEGFPDLAHDDEVDACSGALEMLNPDMEGYGAFEAMRQRVEELL